jgi:PAS domain S-box-containing protein
MMNNAEYFEFKKCLPLKEKSIIKLLMFIAATMAVALPLLNIFVMSSELKRLFIDNAVLMSAEAKKHEIYSFITASSICLYAVGLVFLSAVLIISYKALNALKLRERAEMETSKANEMLELRVMQRTAELYGEVYKRKEIEDGLIESKERYKKLSQQFNALLDAIPDNIILVSPDLKVVWGNKAAAVSVGAQPEDLVGRQCYELWFNRDSMCENCYAMRSFNSGGEEVEEVKPQDGKIYDTRAYPIKDKSGEVTNVIVVAKDVTEKRRIEDELLRAGKLDSIGVLAGGIAHDFNNMLAAISLKIAHAKLLVNSDEKVFTKLTETEEALSVAKTLPQQLLAFSKGAMSLRKIIPIQKILQTSVNMALSGSGCKCELLLPDDLWSIEADEGQIIQAFNNIFINADHAMPNGGIIRVSAENITAIKEAYPFLTAQEYVKISVADEGAGIAAKHIEKIFEPFFSTKAKGSGLGLAIVHSIIKKHNGHVSVESKIGSGTTFHIYLPSCKEDKNIETIDDNIALKCSYKVLVMEDEDNIREELCSLLKRRGYIAEEAKDGSEMLEAYKNAMHSSQPFDAVIMDMVIRGGMGGMAAIKALIELDPHAKAIVASGYFSEQIIDDFKKFGFKGAISKPYNIEDLQRLLNSAITGKG